MAARVPVLPALSDPGSTVSASPFSCATRDTGPVLEQLSRLTAAMHTVWGQEERVRAFIRGVHDMVGFDRVSVWLVTSDTGALELVMPGSADRMGAPSPLPLSPAAGPFYQAFKSHRPVVVLQDGDLEAILPLDDTYRRHPYFRSRRFVIAPLAAGARTIGVVSADNKPSRRWISPGSVELFSLLCQQLATALEEDRLHRETRAREQEAIAVSTGLTLLNQVSRSLHRTLDLDTLLTQALAELAEAFGAAAVIVNLVSETGEINRSLGRWLSEGHRLEVASRHDGVTRLVEQTRGPLILRDIGERRDIVHPAHFTHGVKSLAAFPIICQDHLVRAVLELYYTSCERFPDSQVQLLTAYADHLSTALQNAQLYEESERRRREAHVLAEVAGTLNASLNLQTVLHRVLEAAKELCGSDRAWIALRIPGSDALRIRHWLGPQCRWYETLRIEPGKGVGGKVLRTGRPFRTAHYAEDLRITKDYLALAQELGVIAELAVPIRIDDRVEGLLYVDNCTPRPFTDRDEAILLRLADTAAIAIRNAQLFEQEQEARSAAQTSEQRLRDLVQDLDAVVWEADARTGQFSFMSQRAEGILGYPVNQWLTEPDFWVTRLHPADREQIAAFRRTAVSEGRDYDIEYRCLAAAGRVVWLRDRVHVIRDADGHARQLRGVTVEITERKRLREECLQAEKLATLGELIAGIAHELNNPLAAMVGHAQLLRTNQTDPATIARVERVIQQADRATRVVRNFLTFARKHQAEKVAVSVNEVIGKSLELMAYQLRVGNIIVQTDLTPDLPEIAGDPHQLQQVLLNLVGNAYHAMTAANGQGTLRVASALDRDQASIRITVADDGPGILPEHLPHIFEPFFTTKPSGEGTGLGLPMAQGIVREHGGTIGVESAPGRGATFVITLPVSKTPPTAAPVPTEPRTLPVALRVLVVDDEAPLRELLADALIEQGSWVETAVNGRQALAIIKNSPVDVVTLDVRMPGMGGEELWTKIHQMDPALARRVVFCTGDVVAERTRAFLESTGCLSVTKPFQLDEFLGAIAQAASR